MVTNNLLSTVILAILLYGSVVVSSGYRVSRYLRIFCEFSTYVNETFFSPCCSLASMTQIVQAKSFARELQEQRIAKPASIAKTCTTA